MASSSMATDAYTWSCVHGRGEAKSSLVFKYGTNGKMPPLELKERRAP